MGTVPIVVITVETTVLHYYYSLLAGGVCQAEAQSSAMERYIVVTRGCTISVELDIIIIIITNIYGAPHLPP